MIYGQFQFWEFALLGGLTDHAIPRNARFAPRDDQACFAFPTSPPLSFPFSIRLRNSATTFGCATIAATTLCSFYTRRLQSNDGFPSAAADRPTALGPIDPQRLFWFPLNLPLKHTIQRCFFSPVDVICLETSPLSLVASLPAHAVVSAGAAPITAAVAATPAAVAVNRDSAASLP